MKIKFFAIALAALTLVACEKAPQPIVPVLTYFLGEATVEATAGTVVNADARVEFLPYTDGTADLTLYELSFSPKMPMKLDVTVPGVTYVSTPEKITFSGDGIIPFALGGEFPNYKVTELQGEIVGDKLTFTLKFGGIPTTYTGEKCEAPASLSDSDAK